jgi:hypothetical protein
MEKIRLGTFRAANQPNGAARTASHHRGSSQHPVATAALSAAPSCYQHNLCSDREFERKFISDPLVRMITAGGDAWHVRTQRILDTIETARWSRGHHQETFDDVDPETKFTSIRYDERVTETGATPSFGTVVYSYEKPLQRL